MSKPGPCACGAGTLPTEPSPQTKDRGSLTTISQRISEPKECEATILSARTNQTRMELIVLNVTQQTKPLREHLGSKVLKSTWPTMPELEQWERTLCLNPDQERVFQSNLVRNTQLLKTVVLFSCYCLIKPTTGPQAQWECCLFCRKVTARVHTL